MTPSPGAASGGRVPGGGDRRPGSGRPVGAWPEEREADQAGPPPGGPGRRDDDEQRGASAGAGGPGGPGGDTAGAAEGGAPTGDVAGGTILTDVAGLAAERDEYLTALQRLQADFENYRKRVARQQEEQSVRAAVDLVSKVLPVLDTLDLARAHLGGGEAAGEEGKALDQARSQLLDVLGKEGLERVDEPGIEFDPVVHDAVAHAPADEEGTAAAAPAGDGTAPGAGGSDGPAGSGPGPAPAAPAAPGTVTVDEVLRAGYRWRGQVLRPAMVRVRG